MQPNVHRKTTSDRRKAVRSAAVDLLRVVARHGHSDPVAQRRAFAAGLATFGKWGHQFDFDSDQDATATRLDNALKILLALNGAGKQMLLTALTATVMSDKTLSVAESELLRAICASLGCPLPPILTAPAAG